MCVPPRALSQTRSSCFYKSDGAGGLGGMGTEDRQSPERFSQTWKMVIVVLFLVSLFH